MVFQELTSTAIAGAITMLNWRRVSMLLGFCTALTVIDFDSVLAYEHMGKPAIDGVWMGDSIPFRLGELLVLFDSGVTYDSALNILTEYDIAPYVDEYTDRWIWCECDTSRSVSLLCDTLGLESAVSVAIPNILLQFPHAPSD